MKFFFSRLILIQVMPYLVVNADVSFGSRLETKSCPCACLIKHCAVKTYGGINI
jgi:hypothetical protein